MSIIWFVYEDLGTKLGGRFSSNSENWLGMLTKPNLLIASFRYFVSRSSYLGNYDNIVLKHFIQDTGIIVIRLLASFEIYIIPFPL